MKNNPRLKFVTKVLCRVSITLLTVLCLIVFALLTVIWVLEKGPSPTAQRIFVMSVNETSAIKWIANIFLSDAEVEEILGIKDEYEESGTNTALISVPPPGAPPKQSAKQADNNPDNLSDDVSFDDDYDGIELVEITGKGYTGYMLIIDDPKRVFVGTPDEYGEDKKGLTLKAMVNKYGAVAGINGGGFEDIDGTGLGGIPDGTVIVSGKIMWGGGGYIIGFDADGILHTGTMSAQKIKDLGIQWACSFGPTLISNGVAAQQSVLSSGVNPRTAIGQRADGAVLMLVVDGRILGSLGATYEDLVEIFFDFGAVNAANLDGGSSTEMMLYGERVNTTSVIYSRDLPTAFLVRPYEYE